MTRKKKRAKDKNLCNEIFNNYSQLTHKLAFTSVRLTRNLFKFIVFFKLFLCLKEIKFPVPMSLSSSFPFTVTGTRVVHF